MCSKEDYHKWIDLLIVIAIFGVVYLHSNNFEALNNPINSYSFGPTLREGLFYYSAPLFFMLTGAKLLNYKKRYSTKTFIKKE